MHDVVHEFVHCENCPRLHCKACRATHDRLAILTPVRGSVPPVFALTVRRFLGNNHGVVKVADKDLWKVTKAVFGCHCHSVSKIARKGKCSRCIGHTLIASDRQMADRNRRIVVPDCLLLDGPTAVLSYCLGNIGIHGFATLATTPVCLLQLEVVGNVVLSFKV